jgi:glycosyltransferase involved in cell wall biosynthesis
MTAIDQPAPKRGRVVMLVDNGVEGDSRVQKQARSAAAAGWDVTLLGFRPHTAIRSEWTLGDATVQLIQLKRPLQSHRTTLRWSPRRPLAYGGLAMANNRLQTARMWQTDLTMRFAALQIARHAGGSARQEQLARLRLFPNRVAYKIFNTWVHFRAGEWNRLKAARENHASLLNRAMIRFWQVTRGDRSWRRLDPTLSDFEVGFRRVVDRLDPDIIHANDYRVLGVAARAKLRARARGRDVKVVWDAHEYVPGLAPVAWWPSWLPAQIAYEREFARHADAVVTVSPALAELLRDGHGLTELPAVVQNCPQRDEIGADGVDPALDLRADCGVTADTPLLAYCGGITPVRGVTLMVEALPDLPGVHVAFVSLHPNGNRRNIDEIEALAEELGVADRVHLLPYVKHWQVVPYLSSADAAVSPLLHLPNHEIALSNKFFEYSHARLPLVTSDVRTMSEVVHRTGQGEVFKAGDRDDYLRAVRAVLADPHKYRAAYDAPGLLVQWSWNAQATILEQVYSSLMPAPAPAPEPEPVLAQRTDSTMDLVGQSAG